MKHIFLEIFNDFKLINKLSWSEKKSIINHCSYVRFCQKFLLKVKGETQIEKRIFAVIVLLKMFVELFTREIRFWAKLAKKNMITGAGNQFLICN